jgi:RHS repeat-associated protein
MARLGRRDSTPPAYPVTAAPTGMLLTSYTYDHVNHLTQVAMPRNTSNGMKTQTRTFVYQAQYPYGVEYTLTVNDREKYATYTRDSVTGLDYAVNRYYSSQWGRFLSPDPYGGSAATGNPQSWNRYAYVGSDPVNSTDPSGLAILAPDGPDGPDDPGSGPIWGFNGPSSSGGGWLFGGGCNGLPNPGNWYDAGLSSPWFGGTAPWCALGFLPSGGAFGGGGGGGGWGDMQIAVNAAMRASDRIVSPDCAGIFLSPDANTAEQRQVLSGQLQYLADAGDLRVISPSALPAGTPAGVAAFTTGLWGFVYVIAGGPFFTGTSNGQPLSGPFQGLTLPQVQELTIIHEFLHWEGLGPDNAGQTYTLPNGDTVTGSLGISQEVRNKCFK